MRQEKFLKANDGTKICYQIDTPINSKAVVVIVHGFAEHHRRYDYVVEKLNNEGYICYRFDLRGHGRSGGDTLDLDDYNEYISDTDMIVNLAKEQHPDLPIFMLGHSMGGYITALYGEQYPDKLNGQILSGAATGEPKQMNSALRVVLKVANKVCPRKRVKNDLSAFVSRDNDVVEAYRNDELIHDKPTFRLLYNFTIAGMTKLRENESSYNYDCLILHGGDDKIIDNNNSKLFFNNISSKNKKIKVYDNLYHEIMNEKEKDTVLADIIDWLDSKIV